MTELCLDEVLDVDMGRYTGIVWVIIVNNHHTQEFLSQLTLVIKKIPGSDWERIRDFCTKKRGSRFGSLSFQNMEINGTYYHSSAASAVADLIIVVGVLDLAFADS